MEIMQIALVALVFALAGCVKGITGMGLPTVAISLLGLWMPPAQAAALLVLPSLATNVAQCRGPHLRQLADRLWPGWLAIALATAFAPGLGGRVPADSASRWLGVVLACYGLWGLWRPTLPDLSGSGRWLGALAGMATGLITSLTSVFVLPWVPYLQSLQLDKESTIQALGLSFTVATLALAFRLQASTPWGEVSASTVLLTGGAMAGAFTGLKLGNMLRARLAGPAFQKTLYLVFLALGAANLMKGA